MPIPKDREEAIRVSIVLAEHGSSCAACGTKLRLVGGPRWVLFRGQPACLDSRCLEAIRRKESGRG